MCHFFYEQECTMSADDFDSNVRNEVTEVVQRPILQWANGRATGENGSVVGFYTERGKDDDLDSLLESIGTQVIILYHTREKGEEAREHWYFGKDIIVYPITKGPVAPTLGRSLYGETRIKTAQSGIACRWDEGGKSRASVRCYIEPLVKHGHYFLMQLSTSATGTDDLITALIDHIRVCKAADGWIDRVEGLRQRHPDLVRPCEIGLPLGGGVRTSRGKGKTTMIYPLVSKHPEEVPDNYISKMWCRTKVNDNGEVVKEGGQGVVDFARLVWKDIMSWSMETTMRQAEAVSPAQPQQAQSEHHEERGV